MAEAQPVNTSQEETELLDFDTAAVASAPVDDQLVAPLPEFVERAVVKSREQYDILYKQSIEQPDIFWGSIADTYYWHKRWDVSMNVDFQPRCVSRSPRYSRLLYSVHASMCRAWYRLTLMSAKALFSPNGLRVASQTFATIASTGMLRLVWAIKWRYFGKATMWVSKDSGPTLSCRRRQDWLPLQNLLVFVRPSTIELGGCHIKLIVSEILRVRLRC